MIRGVVFDLGSTLIRFRGDWLEVMREGCDAFARNLREQGYPVKESALSEALLQALLQNNEKREQDHIEKTTTAVAREVIQNLPLEQVAPEHLAAALDAMYAPSEVLWEPMPMMRSVLDRLHAQGYRMGLISNAGDAANVLRLIDRFNLGDDFNPILISAEKGYRKPDRRIFEDLLKVWRLPAEEAVMIGDRLEADILGAQNAGMHNIWLRSEAKDPPADGLAEIAPEAVAQALEEVPDLIERINGSA